MLSRKKEKRIKLVWLLHEIPEKRESGCPIAVQGAKDLLF